MRRSQFRKAKDQNKNEVNTHASAAGAAAAESEIPVKPTVETITTPPCTKWAGSASNTRKPWQGPVNCGVYARAFREATSFFCVHVVAVNPNAYPATATFEVSGMSEAIVGGPDSPLSSPCQ